MWLVLHPQSIGTKMNGSKFAECGCDNYLVTRYDLHEYGCKLKKMKTIVDLFPYGNWMHETGFDCQCNPELNETETIIEIVHNELE